MLDLLRVRIVCPSIVLFAVAISIFTALLHNWRFWHDVISTVGPTSHFEVLCLASIFSIFVFVHATLLLFIPSARALRVTAAVLVVIGAATAYFSDSLGVVVDKTIIRSVLDTDKQEASALLTWRFAGYLVFAGLIPSAAILRIQFTHSESAFDIRQRISFAAAAALTSTALVVAMYSFHAPFWRNHRSVIHWINPDTALVAAAEYVGDYFKSASAPEIMTNPAGPTRVLAGSQKRKPLLMFLNVGETARAANFQLGGYGRDTNPELFGQEGLFYFGNASSCGTATAISVPCLFSHGGRNTFSVANSARQTNLVDAVAGGGYRVEWRENNSGGKGVPDRVKTIVYDPGSDPKLCANGTCFDEIMLTGLADELRAQPQNTMIVFHHMGSHGPSYWMRYPERFEKFQPACRNNELWRCPHEELLNAYDNTIAYTDFVLAEQIRLMNALSDQFDSVMIYASDHGESLGEKGLYLHGAPYVFAPKEQTHIPFLLWLSKGYRNRVALDEACMKSLSKTPVSHDNIYHTVLGALGLTNDVYRNELDLVTPCASDPRRAS